MTRNVNIHRKKNKHFYSLMTADDNINQLIKELETHLTDKKAHFFLSKDYRETRYRNRNQGTLTDKL